MRGATAGAVMVDSLFQGTVYPGMGCQAEVIIAAEIDQGRALNLQGRGAAGGDIEPRAVEMLQAALIQLRLSLASIDFID